MISWQDDRTADLCARLEAEGAAAPVMDRAGLPLDLCFSASKLGWILRHGQQATELAAAGHLRLGRTDAFFRDRLTGRFEMEVATASRTSLMTLGTGARDADLLCLFGMPITALPQIGPTSGDLGTLPGGAVLSVLIVDRQAALYDHGCRLPGSAKVTFGTGAFAQCVTGALLRPDRPGPQPTLAWQRASELVAYPLDGGVSAAASAVHWAQGLGPFTDHVEISAFADRPAIDRGLALVPARAGLGCPHGIRSAPGARLGLALASGRQDLMQALSEGVAPRTAEALDAHAELQPIRGAVSVDRGLLRNGSFIGFLSQVGGQDLFLRGECEQTAAGLARSAAEASGLDLPQPAEGRHLAARPLHRAARLARFAAARQALEGFAAGLG